MQYNNISTLVWWGSFIMKQNANRTTIPNLTKFQPKIKSALSCKGHVWLSAFGLWLLTIGLSDLKVWIHWAARVVSFSKIFTLNHCMQWGWTPTLFIFTPRFLSRHALYWKFPDPTLFRNFVELCAASRKTAGH